MKILPRPAMLCYVRQGVGHNLPRRDSVLGDVLLAFDEREGEHAPGWTGTGGVEVSEGSYFDAVFAPAATKGRAPGSGTRRVVSIPSFALFSESYGPAGSSTRSRTRSFPDEVSARNVVMLTELLRRETEKCDGGHE